MQLSDIFLGLGEETFQQLMRSVSMGRLRTYQLFDRVKTRLHLHKLSSETLRKATPRLWERLKEDPDEDFATDLAQAILVSHLDMIKAVLDHLGVPHEDGFFAKDADVSGYLEGRLAAGRLDQIPGHLLARRAAILYQPPRLGRSPRPSKSLPQTRPGRDRKGADRR